MPASLHRAFEQPVGGLFGGFGAQCDIDVIRTLNQYVTVLGAYRTRLLIDSLVLHGGTNGRTRLALHARRNAGRAKDRSTLARARGRSLWP